jgi:cell division protein FtsL
MKNYMNFKNLTFIGLLFLAFQNYKTRNTLNELKAKIEYSHFELNEIKKEAAEANKYAKSANTIAFQIQSSIINENK